MCNYLCCVRRSGMAGLSVTIDVMYYHDQSKLGRKSFISVTFAHLHSSAKEVRTRTNRARNWRQELMHKQWQYAAYCLTPYGSLNGIGPHKLIGIALLSVNFWIMCGLRGSVSL